jgi:hypothetical protein
MILNSSQDEDKINIIPMIDGLGFTDNFKIKISAPQLNHDFELFPIFKDDFMSTVANFHMSCVRAYYNGENVYMTPSCISAHMTFMNIDYKYFAGSKDPIEIINKYRLRGFGCWLNKNELNIYVKYNSEVQFWKNLYNINPNIKQTYSRCFGPIMINCAFYRPRLHNAHLINNQKLFPINIGSYYISRAPKILTEDDYYHYRYNSKKNMIKLPNTINKDTGYIEPLQRSIINSKLYNQSLEQVEPTNNWNDYEPENGWVPAPPQLELVNVAAQVAAIEQAVGAQIAAGAAMAQAEIAQA